MYKISLFYFSGTGNTLLVLKELIKHLKNKLKNVQITAYPIHRTNARNIVFENEELVGFVFPVAFQGTYYFIWRFIENLPIVSDKKVYAFMLDTLHSFSGGVVGPLKKLLKQKDYHVLYAKEIRMPSNLLRKHIDSKKDAKKIQSSLSKIPGIVDELLLAFFQKKDMWPRFPLFSDFMSLFSRTKLPWSFAQKLYSFSVDTDRCTKCGICSNVCPLDVINLKKAFPSWEMSKCQFCMRCFAFCPTNAILINGNRYKQYKAINLGELYKWEKVNYF